MRGAASPPILIRFGQAVGQLEFPGAGLENADNAFVDALGSTVSR